MKAVSKFAMRGGMLVLLAGGIVAVGFKQSAVARLRAEQQVLLSESQEARQLAAENEGIAKLREEYAEVVKLRDENKDLPRLRNEARQLRRQAEESGKLSAENERLRDTISANQSRGKSGAPALPADFVTRAAMGDVGLSTPEAAVQTAFWAMSQGNLERVAQCFVDGGPNLNNAERERTDMMEGMKSFPGFRIAEKKMISPDEVELGMQSSMGGPAAPIKLKLVGNEWKIQQH